MLQVRATVPRQPQGDPQSSPPSRGGTPKVRSGPPNLLLARTEPSKPRRIPQTNPTGREFPPEQEGLHEPAPQPRQSLVHPQIPPLNPAFSPEGASWTAKPTPNQRLSFLQPQDPPKQSLRAQKPLQTAHKGLRRLPRPESPPPRAGNPLQTRPATPGIPPLPRLPGRRLQPPPVPSVPPKPLPPRLPPHPGH